MSMKGASVERVKRIKANPMKHALAWFSRTLLQYDCRRLGLKTGGSKGVLVLRLQSS